ncbi:MAG TPA: hypothetical protein VFE28_13935 [Candidatus Krumholzibacteria bacterium]|nr:hypothetical protein [Candidatus Krumholzibacteria bacterium]
MAATRRAVPALLRALRRASGCALFLAFSSTAAFTTGEKANPVAPPATQSLRAEDVRIEGKLYSPQALFIVSRPEERFGRDVLSHYLNLDASGRVLPYRLRPECLRAQTAVVPAPAPAPAAPADSSTARSP